MTPKEKIIEISEHFIKVIDVFFKHIKMPNYSYSVDYKNIESDGYAQIVINDYNLMIVIGKNLIEFYGLSYDSTIDFTNEKLLCDFNYDENSLTTCYHKLVDIMNSNELLDIQIKVGEIK